MHRSVSEWLRYAHSFIKREPFVIVGANWRGAFIMRGLSVAQRLGCPTCPPWRVPRCRTALLVKSPQGFESRVRRSCERLIYDRVDTWDCPNSDGNGYRGSPEHYFQHSYRRIQFDTLLLHTRAAVKVASSALPQSVEVLFGPHQADERIRPDCYDSHGPIIYVGRIDYIESRIEEIQDACRNIGKELVVSSDIAALRGASFALALRLPPHDTPMNRLAKPQIKLENAASAGLPVLASNHECIISVRPEVTTWDDVKGGRLDEALRDALQQQPLHNPVTLEHHCRFIESLMC